MKKILVIFTGGTIGSRIHNSTIDVDDQAGNNLLQEFQNNKKYSVEFEAIQPMNILSENCIPDHWQQLYDVIKQIDFSHYEGIIITHGSDTLPYTSAALSFLFRDTQIPIVLTASNYALGCSKSNGMVNFRSSVDFIINTGIPGIYTIFQNDKGKNIVYLATRIMEADPYKDQYGSFGGDYFGEIKNGNFILRKSKINPTRKALSQPREKLTEDIIFQNQVLTFRSYPGLNYESIDFKNKPRAILHSLYHSGTGCTGKAGFSLSEFVKRCKEEDIDIYLNSFKNIDSDLYKTSREILEYGAVPLQNISFEAAYVKLCIAYNQTVMSPREYIEKELFFEYLPRCY